MAPCREVVYATYMRDGPISWPGDFSPAGMSSSQSGHAIANSYICDVLIIFGCCFFFGDSVGQGEDDDTPEDDFLRVQNITSQLKKTETNPCSVSKKQGGV